jgi:hypothetical protein
MVKQEALMESLSSNLKGFLNQIQGNLSVPDKKFLWDGFIGLVRAGRQLRQTDGGQVLWIPANDIRE